jgi:hypothetical protein
MSARTAGLSWLLWDRKTSNACFSRASSIMEEYTADAAKGQASVAAVGETDRGYTAGKRAPLLLLEARKAVNAHKSAPRCVRNSVASPGTQDRVMLFFVQQSQTQNGPTLRFFY